MLPLRPAIVQGGFHQFRPQEITEHGTGNIKSNLPNPVSPHDPFQEPDFGRGQSKCWLIKRQASASNVWVTVAT